MILSRASSSSIHRFLPSTLRNHPKSLPNKTKITKRVLSNHYNEIPSRPFRSVLYVPASNTRALQKLASLTGKSKPDAVMFDLEDGVGPDSKDVARENLLDFFKDTTSSGEHSFFKLVRVNRMDTPWFEEDASLTASLFKDFDAVVLPKVEGCIDVEMALARFSDCTPAQVPIWAMMETPLAILSAASIASHQSIHGLILGTNDLGKELQLRPTASAKTTELSASSSSPSFSIGSTSATCREGLIASLQTTIIAARAYGKIVIDGVYNNFRDAQGFHYECMQGKEWGMDGKTLIHPSQISVTNEIFAPSEDEVSYAKKVVKCWEEATKEDKFSGVAVLDGALIELLHVKTARKIIDTAERIKAIEDQY